MRAVHIKGKNVYCPSLYTFPIQCCYLLFERASAWRPSYFWPKFTIIWISSYRHQFYHNISLALWDQSLPTVSGGLFCGTQKMHISEYVRKTCLKELGILLKCRETFEKFLAACSSSKNTGLPRFFFKAFWQLYFKNNNFLTKTKRCLYADFYKSKINYDDWQRQAKPNFPKKVNPMKYPVHSYILVRTWNLLFMCFTGVSH